MTVSSTSPSDPAATNAGQHVHDAGGARVAELVQGVERVHALAEAAVAGGDAAILDAHAVSQLVASAIELHFARAGDRDGFVPGPDVVPSTEALTLVAALLRAHDLNTFDLALWLSRTADG